MAYNNNNYSGGNRGGYGGNRGNGYGDNRNGGYNSNRSNGYGDNRNNDRRYQQQNKTEDGQNNSSQKKLPDKFCEVYKNGNLNLNVINDTMKDYMKPDKPKSETIKQSNEPKITTTKLRNIMSMISEIYNFESRRKDEKLSADSVAKLQRLRIRIVYEYGRTETNKAFKPFCNRFKILDYLVEISNDYNRVYFFGYALFFESLVAYHRFYGGEN
ncbi:MAG: type III-A CRISPR-associated protein Csm2 [Clostridia bacterium]|nr:type III-A CRISPR-associated protein Csm2 [Clostridia bacterium]